MGSDASGRGSNPLFNDNRMKLGTFCTDCSNGTVASTAEGTLQQQFIDDVFSLMEQAGLRTPLRPAISSEA